MSVNLEIDVRANRRAAKQIATSYMREPFYVACEELDFGWNHEDVKAFDHMWKNQLGIQEMVNVFKRPADELVILTIDRASKGFIEPRWGGIFGNRRTIR